MLDIDFSLYVKRLSQSPPTLVGALATALLVILQFVRMEAERGFFVADSFHVLPKLGQTRIDLVYPIKNYDINVHNTIFDFRIFNLFCYLWW